MDILNCDFELPRFRSPSHAMGAQYLSIAWPLFALTLVLSLGLFHRFKNILLISLCILIGLFGSLSVSNYIKTNIETFNPKPLLQSSNMIVIDNVSRGAFPRIFMHVPDQTLIFAASQSYLLNHKEEWPYEPVPKFRSQLQT